jgi:hypothetical protein
MLTLKKLIALTHAPPARTNRYTGGKCRPPNIVGNSSSVGVDFHKCTSGKDTRGYYHAVKGTAISARKDPDTPKRKKNWEIRLYYPKGKTKKDQYIPVDLRGSVPYFGPKEPPKFTDDCKAWVFCTCEYFLFHCEFADDLVDNSTINPQSSRLKRNFYTTSKGKLIKITDNNGAPPVETNPNYQAHMCKHLLAALRKGALQKK